jgi:hypothetical protein
MDPNPARRRRTLIWLIISQLLALASLLIWLLVAGLSVMAFDQGSTPEAWTIVIAVWSYPIIPLVLAAGAWIAFGFHRYLLANVLSTITFLPPVLLYVFLWLMQFTY